MPHTKQQIQNFLNEIDSHPHHKWGQNFLIDLNLMHIVVDSIAITKNDLVLEVGHGTGSLTELLSEAAGKVIAVDIDPAMHEIASRELSARDNVTFLHCDALAKKHQVAPEIIAAVNQQKALLSGRFVLVANLPYNIASPLIVNLLTESPSLDALCVTVQEEVADRICAGPEQGGAYGKLSVVLQAAGKVKKVRTIKPSSFWPSPKINSAIVSWYSTGELNTEEIESLKKCCDQLLNKRRKQLQSCLPKGQVKDNIVNLLQELNIDPQIRAEKLSPQQFVQIAKILD